MAKLSMVIQPGQRFGMLEAIKDVGHGKWLCKCDCGNVGEFLGKELRGGRRHSCGCKKHRPRKESLAGKQFGEWEVLGYVGKNKWHCRCSCGVERNIDRGDLEKGRTKSCGHATTGFKDLTGKRFNEWEVLSYLGESKYECRCSCGKLGIVTRRDLLTGQSKSCGHSTNSLVDLTGKHLGEWTVLKHTGYGYWLCQCSCGTIKEVRHTELLNGDSKSCGCKQGEYLRKTMQERYGDIASCRINNPRTPEQFKMTESAENLRAAILANFSEKPSIFELQKLLNVSYSKAIVLIHKYKLESLVSIYDNISHYEKDICDFIHIIDKGIEIKRQDRDTLNGKEIDIWIPSKMLAIEFNGDYWHSNAFKPIEYHQNKTLLALKNRVRLIHIFEYEWKNERKQRILKEMIYGAIANNRDTIYARNCVISKIETSVEREFLERHHLQGYVASNIAYGCYYNNKLIGIMTFGKPRFNQSFEYELLRLAWDAQYNVIGGAEKLFKHFISENNPKSIVSYCDLSKFTGNVYFRLGFKTEIKNISRPNYVWVKSYENIVKSRYQTQKHKLLDDGLGEYGNTEDEIMDNLGFLKIYDSGNIRFEWLAEGS